MKAKHLSDFKVTRTDSDLTDFVNYIFSQLGDGLFLINNEVSFVHQCLKQIEPFHSELEYTEQSIGEACLKVMEYFQLSEWLEDKSFNPIQKFFTDFLQFETPPLYTLKELQTKVYEDLSKLQNLLKRYESDPFIKQYIQDGETPRNHLEKTKRDFYKRCIQAQQEINDYLVNGIKKRALQRAKVVPDFLKNMISYSLSDVFQDRPYPFGNPYKDMTQFYDYKRIDVFRHRIVNVDITYSSKLSELYTTDKVSFYQALANFTSPDAIFDSFKYYLRQLPFKYDRRSIFKELEVLFKGEHWIGFYALALTQVEGIFTEMSGVLTKKVNSSLPDKVKHVRPHYNMSIYSFDYYEYYIPNQRNKFMHVGYDEDFHIKALDLLYDIYHLLNVFMELDNPKVKLSRIHTTKNQKTFYSIDGFAEYFSLLNALKNEDRVELKDVITAFEKDVLCEGEIADSICLEACLQIPILLLYFKDTLDRNLEIYNTSFDFEKSNIKIIEEVIKKRENFDALSDTLSTHEAELLLSYASLLTNYKKHLPSISPESIAKLSEVHQEHGKIIKLIMQTNELLSRSS